MAIGFKKFIIGKPGKGQSTESVIQYLADPQARGDYYSESGQAVLGWLSTPRLQRWGALMGPIVLGRAAMHLLLEGRHPVTGEVIRRWGPNGTMVGAIDVTLSPAPKSVSALWALADTETRHQIERMVSIAADLAIAALMRKPLVRDRFGRGKNDVQHVAMADIIGVQTLHTTARLAERGDGVPDPQLHVHNLLIGALDEKGRLRALDSRQLMKYQREIDAEAKATLAEMLRRAGYPIERTVDAKGRVGFELAGIPEAVLKAFSQRRAEITDEGPGSLRALYREWSRQKYGVEREPEGQEWNDFVAAHRGPKALLQGRALRTAWIETGSAAGWGRAEALAYAQLASQIAAAGGIRASDDRLEDIEEFRRHVLDEVCRENALVPKSHVDAVMFEQAVGLIDTLTALTVVGEMYRDGDLLVTKDDGRVTTLEVLVQEQRARRAAQELLDAAPRQGPSLEEVERAIEEASREGRPFDVHQRNAVKVATSGSRFVSITGKAGTGKGVTAGVIGPLLQAQGCQVIALAVAGRTAQQAGKDARAELARTIDGLVYAVEQGHRHLGPNTVLLVDEAAMIDHHRYAQLLELAAQAGATVIQVGDDRQLSPIGPGGLWTLLHAAAAERGQTAELRIVYRANDVLEGNAWNNLRDGQVVEALSYWQGRGRLRLYESRSELLRGMVAEWRTDPARSLMVVDTSNAERDRLNELAQAQRLEAGELGAAALQLTSGRQLRAGDRVIFREITYLQPRTGPARVPRIENGTEATVTNLDAHVGRLELLLHEAKGERRVSVGLDAVLELAYARHVQLGQGMTVEGAGQVGVSASTHRETAYVMVSRARAGAVIHAVRSEAAALAAPSLGPITEAQQAALQRLGVSDVPEDWTWADASVEIEARRGEPLGTWSMAHLMDVVKVERALAAHLVVQAITRRQLETDEPIRLEEVAESIRAVLSAAAPAREGDQQAAEPESERTQWEAFLAALEAHKQALEARAGLARLLERESRKEAVGDREHGPDPVEWQAKTADRDLKTIARESRAADQDYRLARIWREQQRDEQLQELPLPQREPDLSAVRLADGTQLARGQVVRFGHPDWLVGAARGEVQAGDLGIVLGAHRGGVTYDYATVELVGGRWVHVWETAEAITVEHDLTPDVVRDAIPRPDQRDPVALNVYELTNGVRLMAGDRVRLSATAELEGVGRVDAGIEATVAEIDRHQRNRMVLELEDGRQARAYTQAPLEIVRPAQEATTMPAPAPPDRQAQLEAGVARGQDRWTEPLAAAHPLEFAARWEGSDQTPRALAMYDALGQLHVSPQPEREAARRWLSDPQAVIVVQDWQQADRVRRAVADEREAARGRQAAAEVTDRQPARQAGPPVPPDREPTVLLAEAAYRSRLEAERSADEGAFPAPERAYVVGGWPSHDAWVQAVSVARTSHLVTTPPDERTAQLQVAHAAEIEQAMALARAEAAERADADREATVQRTRELAHEVGQDSQRQTDRDLGRDPQPSPEIEPSPGGATER